MAIAQGQPEDVQLTVYNKGFALVRESRVFNLRSGMQEVSVEDVAAMIEANSVGVRNLTDPKGFRVLEQNYQYDLISPSAILNKAVGQVIVFNRVLPNGQREVVRGTLLSAPYATVSDQYGNQSGSWNGMVIRTEDGRILLNPTGEIEVSSLPNGLISKPTLVWMVDSARAGESKVEMSYLTQGMNWSADYVLSLDAKGTAGDLNGWVTMTNNSGATFEGAKLKLLAGDVYRVVPRMRMAAKNEAMRFDADAGRGGFQEESFAEYHLYTLQRPATLKNKEIKQISLLEAQGMKVDKKLVVDAMRTYSGWRPSEGEVGTGPITPLFLVEFENTEANQLGIPLPEGTVKVYQRDSSGGSQMIGEASIDHTPRKERISLPVGRSFDVVASRKRTSFNWIRFGSSITGARETYQIEVRNRKQEPTTVHVYERHWGEYKISGNSLPFVQEDSNTIVFKVDLKADEVKTVQYTVETTW
ncbi:MAG: DUF4139 domain-containing protein [Fimbriimonadaceae bacterium]|nr:DUF4139 domain-containing protein [Fimbriimonadaceae bacterium]QYK54713.1 MAG: DUF4139 domain-containing protein [Fimbriimonadaceae bacterium]